MQKKLWLTPLGSLAALGALTFAPAASAQAVPQGTFTVAAERMVGLGITFGQGGDPVFGTGLFWGGQGVLDFPRIGVDYFVIDGLSIGGSLGLRYTSAGTGFFQAGILPRIGYAFALSSSIDFWPRGGIGFVTNDPGTTEGALYLEAPFVWNVNQHVGFEFGPAFDALLGPGILTLGGNAGMVARF